MTAPLGVATPFEVRARLTPRGTRTYEIRRAGGHWIKTTRKYCEAAVAARTASWTDR